MPAGKIRNLRARPLQSAELCFGVDGIVGDMNVALGASVTPFVFSTFYAGLDTTVTPSATVAPGLLQYNSEGIRSDANITASLLCTLRAESTAASLDKAVAARQNAFLAKYLNQAAIIAEMLRYYSPTRGGSKPKRLAELARLSAAQAAALNAAYTADHRLGVVKWTTGYLGSITASGEASVTVGIGVSRGVSNTSSTDTIDTTAQTSGIDYGGESGFTESENSSGMVTEGLTGDHTGETVNTTTYNWGTDKTVSKETDAQKSANEAVMKETGEAKTIQETQNVDYGYRIPAIENLAQFERAQISLMDQQFSQFMFGQNLPNLSTVFQNELQVIDLGVRQLQLAYLNTILMSPITGVVAGVYKSRGDRVKAGETVVRVEDNTIILLEGTLIYRGQLDINSSNVTVTTSVFGSSTSLTITGTVVAVRGRRSADDEWDVVVQCTNPSDSLGNPTLPPNYHFDYDDTTVTIS